MDKKADNNILNYQNQINTLDNKIDNEKIIIKKIEKIQDDVVALTKSVDKCIDLLYKSIKGPTTNYEFDDMRNFNRKFLIETTNELDEETYQTQKKINKLTQEKEEILKHSRESQNRGDDSADNISKEE